MQETSNLFGILVSPSINLIQDAKAQKYVVSKYTRHLDINDPQIDIGLVVEGAGPPVLNWCKAHCDGYMLGGALG